jgi:hypothetical protein
MVSCPAALYPIDTIKTRMQMARTGGGVRALFKSGGGKALYAGEPAMALMSACHTAHRCNLSTASHHACLGRNEFNV